MIRVEGLGYKGSVEGFCGILSGLLQGSQANPYLWPKKPTCWGFGLWFFKQFLKAFGRLGYVQVGC